MLLGLAVIPGSMVPQTRVDPNAVANWQLLHPDLTPLFKRIGLFQVYGTPWFSAVYILLMVSLIGCILPRTRVYWRAALAAPPKAPKNLARLPASLTSTLDVEAADLASRARAQLIRQRFRTRVEEDSDGTIVVSAQRGYLREAGNLIFHISVALVLVAFAVGNLFGFRGGAIVVDGQTFTNDVQSYDDFAPGTLFRDSQLEPFSFTLKDFSVKFLTSGPAMGQASSFTGNLAYKADPKASERDATIQVNHPLAIGNTNVFLIGNGYAPVVTVRGGDGEVVYSGPTVFLPENASYASVGVIKAPDAKPTQLGFEGEFLPTYATGQDGQPVSAFPDLAAPALSLTAYSGDLGLGSGVPQSVYSLNKSKLTPFTDASGKPVTLTIGLGQTKKLPNGAGSITFDSVKRYARLQISSTPGEPLALGSVILGLLGLVGSLYIRPRRIWLRIRRTSTGSQVELAGLDRREGRDLNHDLTKFLDTLTKATR
ncbi:cytochrome c biosynthesis protein [Nocardioides phosphati]|uniref:Cytochrome c biosynthesis protein n=2 Tax=Nocardioides phosphati TaxID=1867775 RepID=A0ABQ2N546_9ACTN|nr:cytochrome c biosynthesis protein [Nocardioides phosphati]